MTALDRRAFIGRFLAVAAVGAALVPVAAEAAPLANAIAVGALPDIPVEPAAVRCWWHGGRRICERRPARRVCWWRGGRRICHWR